MPIDLAGAEQFIWSAARLVDRHRYSFLFDHGSPAPVIEALRGYQNPDGGFGHALEPDLRCPSSQPAATLYALEILNEAGAGDHDLARRARSWVGAVAEPDGGVRFVLPGFEGYPHAPWWADSGDATPSSEAGSFLTLGFATAFHDAGVSDDWLTRASEWCWRSIETVEEPGGYWLRYALAFLDSVPDAERASAAIASLAGRLDPSMISPVGGEGEALRPLDLSPRPASRSRELVGQARIDAHLDNIESEQQDDGGWMFDWLAWSPVQTSRSAGSTWPHRDALKWPHPRTRCTCCCPFYHSAPALMRLW